jgi:hypothetical protein
LKEEKGKMRKKKKKRKRNRRHKRGLRRRRMIRQNKNNCTFLSSPHFHCSGIKFLPVLRPQG